MAEYINREALEYMERQVRRHHRNYEAEAKRDAPVGMLNRILRKASYYEAAVDALKRSGDR